MRMQRRGKKATVATTCLLCIDWMNGWLSCVRLGERGGGEEGVQGCAASATVAAALHAGLGRRLRRSLPPPRRRHCRCLCCRRLFFALPPLHQLDVRDGLRAQQLPPRQGLLSRASGRVRLGGDTLRFLCARACVDWRADGDACGVRVHVCIKEGGVGVGK